MKVLTYYTAINYPDIRLPFIKASTYPEKRVSGKNKYHIQQAGK